MQTLSKILDFLKKNNIKPKKSLSQNFLIDQNISNKIIKSAKIQPTDTVLEIGPGLGALTQKLLLEKVKIIAIEKDPFFASYIKSLDKNITVFEEDFLKFDLKKISLYKKMKVISNIPYHISSSIIIKLLENYNLFSDIIIMVQEEVAKRIISPIGKNRNSLFIFCHFYANCDFCFSISSNCFFPKPKVTSAVINLKIKKINTKINPKKYHSFVQKLFQTKRKKLFSSLKLLGLSSSFLENIFQYLKIDKNARAENLNPQDFESLFLALKDNLKNF